MRPPGADTFVVSNDVTIVTPLATLWHRSSLRHAIQQRLRSMGKLDWNMLKISQTLTSVAFTFSDLGVGGFPFNRVEHDPIVICLHFLDLSSNQTQAVTNRMLDTCCNIGKLSKLLGTVLPFTNSSTITAVDPFLLLQVLTIYTYVCTVYL
ncbi:hypothetical protein K439DRAFT_1622820 [Ramaria rubella]|nr:hypothetical protein K439DRAFT_1622820 [Ramaria rubella]